MTKNSNLPQFTIKQMLEAGVHFGHKTMRRNPKMSKYIFGSKNGLNIINLEQSAICLHNALKAVKEVAKNNGRILFVATKKQAYDSVAEAAKRSGQYYVNDRWLGGMLTNWKTVSQSIKTLKKIEEQLANDKLDLNKKERLVLDRKRKKLDLALGGIRDMGGYPDLVIIIDINREALALAEAKKLDIPVMAVVDTNTNPDDITFPIPGNDDSVKAIKLYCHLISDAILAGIEENMAISGSDTSKAASKEEPDVKKEKVAKAADSKDKKEEVKEEKKDSKKAVVKKKTTAAKTKSSAIKEKKVVKKTTTKTKAAKTTAKKEDKKKDS